MADFEQQCCDRDERLIRWHPGLRALVIIGGAIGCWSMIGLMLA